MQRLRRFAGSSFGSALLGGLIVAVFGWIAIAAGWIAAPEDDDAGEPALAATPSTTTVDDEGLSIGEIYERTSSGIAYIEVSGPAGEANPFGLPQGNTSSTGSGFVIDDEGHIITNAHVVDGGSEIEVTLGADEEPIEAELVGIDSSTDIAVLRIDPPEGGLNPLELGDSSEVEVGDAVVAIGNPFGLDRTVTAGIVSAVQREIRAPDGFTIQQAIQTDAPINPGNSGGPLLNARGQVIGVNAQIESNGGGGNVGIGFAIPINTAREVAEDLIEDGEVEHAYLGITGAELTEEVADALNLDVDSGVLIQQVEEDSPADRAGLRGGEGVFEIDGQRIVVGGDVITEIDGEPVETMDDVIAAVDARDPGDQIRLTVVRDGEEREVNVRLGDRSERNG
ncbi:MAG TPA: trypsin-like peptidase domain-containing protein [Solirubrobacterales bacterium]